MRKLLPCVDGAPASDTVMSAGLYENTTAQDGVGEFAGVTRTEPTTAEGGAPDVFKMYELRRGIE
jgi:hypothetical protein